MRLTKSFVERVKVPGRFSDGRGGLGLFLLVRPRAGGGLRKGWVQRVTINGRPTNLGLGVPPVVELSEARAAALQNQKALWNGQDPRRRTDERVPTFMEASEIFLALHGPTWKGRNAVGSYRQSIRDYCGGFAHKRVGEVTAGDVEAALTPLWNTKRATARKLRQRIGKVMKWATSRGFRSDNPAEEIADFLPKGGGETRHHRALHHSEVAAALETVRASKASASSIMALEFLTLTATRSGETRGATWDEIDLEGKVWSIPESRMKTGEAHRIPLSSGAIRVLEQAKRLADGSGLVFPSTRRRKALGDRTLALLLATNRIECVPHGFRSSFRNWSAESGYSREVAEAALAHSVSRNQVESSYLSTDLFDRRHELMQAWSDYIGY